VDKFEKGLVTVIGLGCHGDDDGRKDRAQKEKSEAQPLVKLERRER
jgi:hypothetical protein